MTGQHFYWPEEKSLKHGSLCISLLNSAFEFLLGSFLCQVAIPAAAMTSPDWSEAFLKDCTVAPETEVKN